MNMWGIIIILVLIVLGIAWYQSGTEGIKTDPGQSVLGAGKSIFNFGKGIVVKDTTTNSTMVGMVPCTTNEDCDRISECIAGKCLCFTDGNCYRNGVN
jgi:hypothetical protein